MKQNILQVVAFFLLLGTFSTCRKAVDVPVVHVELISPDEHSLWRVPDTVEISFKIEGDQAPDRVSVRVVNKNYIPLFGEKYINMPEMGVPLTVTMAMHALHDTGGAPYYILISASIHNEDQNNYFPVELSNRPLSFQGFYLFVKSSVNQTAITFYGSGLQAVPFARINGNYLASSILDSYEKMYLITGIPAKLRSFSLTEQQQMWQAEPLFPYPVYTDLRTDAGWLFTAMGNGQIAAYSGQTGQPKLVVERMVDSIPEKIAVLDEFVVGAYQSRANGGRSLISFYRVSGVKRHSYPVDFTVVSFINHHDPAKVLVFGNRENESLVTVFNPNENAFTETLQLDVGRIEASCKAEGESYLFATSDKLYVYQMDQHQVRLLKELEDIPLEVMYENVSGTVFVLYAGTLVLYAYPQMTEIAKIDQENEIKGLALSYHYE